MWTPHALTIVFLGSVNEKIRNDTITFGNEFTFHSSQN